MTLVLGLFVPKGRGPVSASEIARAFDVGDDEALSFELGRPETGSTCLVQKSEEPDLERPELGLVRTPWRLFVPTVRAPFTARDLLPAAWAAARDLGGRFSTLEGPLLGDAPADLIAAWDALHRENARALSEACLSAGAPLPPHREGRELERVHALLVELAAKPPEGVARPPFVLALDPRDGEPARFAVRLPLEAARCQLPLVDVVLADLDAQPGEPEHPRVYALDDLLGGAAHRQGDFVELDVDEALRERLRELPSEGLERYRVVTPVEVTDTESLIEG